MQDNNEPMPPVALARPAGQKARTLAEDGRTLSPTMGDRVVDVKPDPPDLRDRFYVPALIDLKLKLDPPKRVEVLDQGQEGACTGFGLAAVINHLNGFRRQAGGEYLPRRVSPRMLYEMAKLHDEWEGEAYSGSSIRGALKGFFHNGVCGEDLAPYHPGATSWTLTKQQAEAARHVGLGAYFRLHPEIIDYHVALNEVRAIYCSARVHRGWEKPRDGRIVPSALQTGGHAFAIVGYDAEGFLIQNSWGDDWGGFEGRPGIAHWSYRDWAANVMDAWVLRLSVPTPKAFDLVKAAVAREAGVGGSGKASPPKRCEIVGHFANIDDAALVETGRYATPLESLTETAEFLARQGAQTTAARRTYDHILFYAHGGLNTQDDSARRIHAMKEVFKRNRIYPIHFMWGTGFTDELLDALAGAYRTSAERVGSFEEFRDRLFEKLARPIGRAVWRQMKEDARRSFLPGGGGYQVMQLFLGMNADLKKPFGIHLVGHSAGSILHGHLLDAIPSMKIKGPPVASLSLMAPACTTELFDNLIRPRIGKTSKADHVKKATVYRLIDSREEDDTVGPLYGRSLLYLVSSAFEDIVRPSMEVPAGQPLLGMEIFAGGTGQVSNLDEVYAGRQKKASDARTHGGFDNDRATMNHLLKTVLGKAFDQSNGFQPHEMEGY
ncbi:hypothetical protein GGD81_001809 [Rhodobium orientis]|uniref:Peptidase C1A papain C-terminal domain-containing protein n=1 Tax=Rhodobium orientis TaxID=34017 RepID=A0A327JTL7_9HYPH|nr:C1 family peptidase [Rhodobium orientis]MBB4302773.1 hypothetical protein [Rhodobium orientis]MBK5948553.1 hypothetical protein [Rhodobium orientis]RAI29819.1 hypothetical protein CH339_02035 [Rhodobium orientis]